MRFIDEISVTVAGGNGGDGSVHWRREKFIPMGGPDGGDGGNGGAVIFVADSSMSTLLDLAFHPILKADNGVPGSDNQKNGKDGENLLWKVPIGSQVFYREELVADLAVGGARWIAARGGKGGKGNTFFKSSTNQAPDYAQPGQPGEEFRFKIVLKSVADIGLVGFPNVGKSTLIAALSEAKPKIADYEFTTLTPNLGVVKIDDGARFVIADIPGLIPDAHLGKGLGLQFLKHIERTKGLAIIIDLFRGEGEFLDRAKFQFEALEHELAQFSAELAKLPRLVVLSKSDLGLDEKNTEEVADFFNKLGQKMFIVSGVTKQGCEEIKRAMFELRAATTQN